MKELKVERELRNSDLEIVRFEFETRVAYQTKHLLAPSQLRHTVVGAVQVSTGQTYRTLDQAQTESTLHISQDA